MKFEIKQLKDPFPYAKVAEVLRKTYFQEYLKAGAVKWTEEYAKYYFNAAQSEELTKNFIFGAFKGDKLVGTLVGRGRDVILDNELRLKKLNLGLLSVDPEFRGQGIAKALVSKLINFAKKEKIDILIAFPEKGRYGDKLLKNHFDFKNYGKTKHLLKLMEEAGLHAARDFYDYNPIIVKIASLFARIPEIGELEGEIRDGEIKDYSEAVNILNSYQARVPISESYLVKEYRTSNENLGKSSSIFGVTQWELYRYLGKTQISEVEKRRLSVKQRLEFARNLFVK